MDSELVRWGEKALQVQDACNGMGVANKGGQYTLSDVVVVGTMVVDKSIGGVTKGGSFHEGNPITSIGFLANHFRLLIYIIQQYQTSSCFQANFIKRQK